jgi:hypothetical protein
MENSTPQYQFEAFVRNIHLATFKNNLDEKYTVDSLWMDKQICYEGEFHRWPVTDYDELYSNFEKLIMMKLNGKNRINNLSVLKPSSTNDMPYMISIDSPDKYASQYLENLLGKYGIQTSFTMVIYKMYFSPENKKSSWNAGALYSWLCENTHLKREVSRGIREEESEEQPTAFFDEERFILAETEGSVKKVLIRPAFTMDKGHFVDLKFIHLRSENQYDKVIVPSSMDNSFFQEIISDSLYFDNEQFHDDFFNRLKSIELF